MTPKYPKFTKRSILNCALGKGREDDELEILRIFRFTYGPKADGDRMVGGFRQIN